MRAKTSTLLVSILLTVSSIPGHSQTVKYNLGDPLRFGMGYNTLTGQYAGKCTVDVPAAEIQPAGDAPSPGQLTKWELSSVQDLSSLTERLDLSASASASFLVGSVSASSQYMRSKSFNSYHEFLYVDATIANATKVWTSPKLLPEMEQKRQRNPLDFLSRCGDAFVKTITDGGELTAVLDLSTTASENRSSLDVAISGNYGSAEGKAQLKSQLQQTLLNRQTKVTVLRAGGTGDLPSYSAVDLIAASQTFPDTVAQRPYPMLAYLASYDTISSAASSLTSKQDAYISPLFRSYRRAMQYAGDLSYIRANTSEFRIITFSPNVQNAEAAFEVLASASVQRVSEDIDFDFSSIDNDKVDKAIYDFDVYTDKLVSLAKSCLNDPKNGCSTAPPPDPTRIQHVVRVFSYQKAWDTAAGPVSIILDPNWVVRVDAIIGNWRIGDASNAPISSCNDLPHKVTNGYIVTGGFDSYYPDNHGTCTYVFLGFRR